MTFFPFVFFSSNFFPSVKLSVVIVRNRIWVAKKPPTHFNTKSYSDVELATPKRVCDLSKNQNFNIFIFEFINGKQNYRTSNKKGVFCLFRSDFCSLSLSHSQFFHFDRKIFRFSQCGQQQLEDSFISPLSLSLSLSFFIYLTPSPLPPPTHESISFLSSFDRRVNSLSSNSNCQCAIVVCVCEIWEVCEQEELRIIDLEAILLYKFCRKTEKLVINFYIGALLR
jgi:hypothetical protein